MRVCGFPHGPKLMMIVLAGAFLMIPGCYPADVTSIPQSAPDPPTMLSPPDGATAEGDAIVFSGSPALGATCYHLELNLDPNWSEDGLVYSNDLCDSTMVELTGFEDDGTTYYWHVWAFNDHG